MNKTMLMIPDVHAMPGQELWRFGSLMAWLEKRDTPIQKIVQIGDLWDFGSLCTLSLIHI